MMHPRAILIDKDDGIWKVYCECAYGCAKFKCLTCNVKWEVKPQGPGTVCPRCGAFYVEWLNYAQWRIDHRET